MKKSAPFIILGLFIVGLLVLGRPHWKLNSSSTASGTQVLAGSLKSFDFGTISMANGKVHREITISNTSQAPVKLGRLFSSCMCTSAAISVNEKNFGPFGMEGMGFIPRIDEVLAPEQTATVSITFDPNAHGPAGVGHIERVVTLENDNGAPLTVSFSADVTP